MKTLDHYKKYTKYFWTQQLQEKLEALIETCVQAELAINHPRMFMFTGETRLNDGRYIESPASLGYMKVTGKDDMHIYASVKNKLKDHFTWIEEVK